MIFLVVLALATAGAAAVQALRRRYSARQSARIGMAVAMAFAGVSHLLMPTPFVQHLPTWVPMREELILVTGLLEIGLGAALLRRPLRRWAGLALAGYLVAVFPSNVYVAVAQVEVEGQPGGAYPWLRLPFQLLFIAWALWSTRDAAGTLAGSSAGTSADAANGTAAAGRPDALRTT
ncbi:MAG TPA: hypothetical protein VFR87_11925 [Nocardioidaceae bacterium]|nr:hypothetical protein [Nocardioidaceae bacterium]